MARTASSVPTWWVVVAALGAASCSGHHGQNTFHDEAMDFGQIQTVAVLPLANLAGNANAPGRVGEMLATMLQATGSMYVLPPGEVSQAILRLKVDAPTAPSSESAAALARELKADVLLGGAVLEYGEVRSGSASGNIISLNLRMMEGKTGRVVWSAASSKGGIGAGSRLLGGGGRPMDDVTQQAIDDLLDQLFARK